MLKQCPHTTVNTMYVTLVTTTGRRRRQASAATVRHQGLALQPWCPPYGNEAGGWSAYACMRGAPRVGKGGAHLHEYGELSKGGGGRAHMPKREGGRPGKVGEEQ